MIPFLRPQDIADILIMSFLVYQLYSWFKNTRALQVVIGLGFLVLVYIITKSLGLFMTSWILQELGTVLFVLIIVVFQGEIRQALYRFSLLRNVFGRQEQFPSLHLPELAEKIFAMAKHRSGALIVFQRRESLEDHLLHGVPLDSLISPQLLATIFCKETPLHDGAVVVQGNRVTQASCHLPLSQRHEIPHFWGTRHRAALGLSERTDAVVVVVSEERGEVSLAIAGEMESIVSSEALAGRLSELLDQPASVNSTISMHQLVFRNIWQKVATVLLVLVAWVVVTAKQGGIITVTVPLKFHDLPDNLVLVRNSPEEVEVQLKAISSLIPSPKELEVMADVDLAKIREGINNLSITPSNLKLPLGLTVSSIKPGQVKVVAERKVSRHLRIRPELVGRLPQRQHLRTVKTDPAAVLVVGPESVVTHLETIATEEVNLATLPPSGVVERRVLPPSPQVRIVGDDIVKVKFAISSN